jgi:hypothetical protein
MPVVIYWEKNVMYKKSRISTIQALTAVCLMVAIPPVTADPVGELPPMSDTGKQMLESQGKSIQDIKETIPAKERVGIPIFPNALYCSEMSMDGMLPTLIMASDASMATVSDWYMQQDGLNWSEQWSMFYVGDKYVMMKSETVMLQDISEDPQANACGLMFEMAGMKTQLSISYKPKSGPN